MGQKLIIRSGGIFVIVCSRNRNHLTTSCRSVVHYACLRLCSSIVHFNPKQLTLFCLMWLISASA